MVYTKFYSAPPWDRREILRYAGVRGDSPEVDALLRKCLPEAENILNCKVCWAEFPLGSQQGQLDLGFTRTASTDLTAHLSGCESLVLFAATVGFALDRLISRYGKISPSKALLFQAIGSERIESLCNAFCRDLAAEKRALGQRVTRRFSPGYGDLPLALQRDIFRVLDCPRKIGLTLNDSLLMSPSKSVTALVGITNSSLCDDHHKPDCVTCENESCVYRRSE